MGAYIRYIINKGTYGVIFMVRNSSRYRKKTLVMFLCIIDCMIILIGRLIFIMISEGEYYSAKARQLQERERSIKAPRGQILDRNGVVLADNQSVYSISVVHNQIKDIDKVVEVLSKELQMDEEAVRKKVEKVTSLEKMKGNVDKETGERIMSYSLDGVKVDESYKRYYPYDNLASKVIGFTGGDYQGIIGLESKYDSYLVGKDGEVAEVTDARGVKQEKYGETIKDSVKGDNLVTTLDYNIQKYCMQAAETTYIRKEADSVSIIAMNPQNGEILAMVDYPEFNLSDPFTLTEEYEGCEDINLMWRNSCLNDTYEPGSTFKIITAAAALEEKVVDLEDSFYCPGYIVVEDRRIRCSKVNGHGSQTFPVAIQNSCNPAFITIGLRLGVDKYYSYFEKFGLLEKTGIDLPGEAGTIMHKKENMGRVELATVAFGKSFQITPIQLMTTVSSIINGGTRVTPHLAKEIKKDDGTLIKSFEFTTQDGICSEETSSTMRMLLEKVVSEGGGNKAAVDGFSIGGKTATSQTIPRSENKYISSFLGFAPADNPQIMLLVKINNPKGAYYGGMIAAPVAGEIFDDILPYVLGTCEK